MKIAQYDTDLTDFQWKILSRHLPKPARTGRPRSCLRRVINSILYVAKSGCPWRLLPNDFPDWKTVYHHFRVWSRSGMWEKLHAMLCQWIRKLNGRKRRPTVAVIDSQTIRSAGHGGPVGYYAAKKTKGRKRFICVDTLGLIIGLFIGQADLPERAGAEKLLAPVFGKLRLKKIFADGSFSGPGFAAWVRQIDPRCEAEIVKRSDDVRGFTVLPKRWVVERTFAWLLHHRRLVRDYEKSFHSARAFVWIASTRILLNQYS